MIDTSSAVGLRVAAAQVTAAAGQVAPGSWLITATNVTITSEAAASNGLAGDIFTPLGIGAIVGNADVAYAWNAGTNVAITGTGSAGGTGDIDANASVLSNSATLLTLDAAGSVHVNAALAGGSTDFTAQGTIYFDAASPTAVLTSGSQTYNGPVQLQANTALASSSAGAISFSSTVDGGTFPES